MMATVFKCIAELDIGQKVSASITAKFYQELFDEVLTAGNCVMLLEHEITSSRESPLPLERVDVKQILPRSVLATLSKQAHKGFRIAVVLPDVETGLRALELRGYERCVTTSSGSEAIILGWIAWLEQYLPEAQGVLVFGHDYEPAFVFENIKGGQSPLSSFCR